MTSPRILAKRRLRPPASRLTIALICALLACDTRPAQAEDGRRSFEQRALVNALAFSPDGRRLAVADDYTGGFSVRDLATERELFRIRGAFGRAPKSIAFSADGRELYVSALHSPFQERRATALTVLDPATGAVLREVEGHWPEMGNGNGAVAIATDASGRWVVAAPQTNILDRRGPTPLATLFAAASPATALMPAGGYAWARASSAALVAVRPDGTQIAMGLSLGEILLCPLPPSASAPADARGIADAASAACLSIPAFADGRSPSAIAYSPDGNTLAVGTVMGERSLGAPRGPAVPPPPDSDRRHLRLFSTLSGDLAAQSDSVDSPASVAFHPTLPLLATASGIRATNQSRLALYDARTLTRLGEIRFREPSGNAVTFSPDGQWLAFGALGVLHLIPIQEIRRAAGLAAPVR